MGAGGGGGGRRRGCRGAAEGAAGGGGGGGGAAEGAEGRRRGRRGGGGGGGVGAAAGRRRGAEGRRVEGRGVEAGGGSCWLRWTPPGLAALQHWRRAPYSRTAQSCLVCTRPRQCHSPRYPHPVPPPATLFPMPLSPPSPPAALISGIASHHAGQLPGWKSLVERLFQRGLLKLVFATGEGAVGRTGSGAVGCCTHTSQMAVPCTRQRQPSSSSLKYHIFNESINRSSPPLARLQARWLPASTCPPALRWCPRCRA